MGGIGRRRGKVHTLQADIGHCLTEMRQAGAQDLAGQGQCAELGAVLGVATIEGQTLCRHQNPLVGIIGVGLDVEHGRRKAPAAWRDDADIAELDRQAVGIALDRIR